MTTRCGECGIEVIESAAVHVGHTILPFGAETPRFVCPSCARWRGHRPPLVFVGRRSAPPMVTERSE